MNGDLSKGGEEKGSGTPNAKERLKRLFSQTGSDRGSPPPDNLMVPFRLLKNQLTRPPYSVPYIHFGYGFLQPTKDRAIHFYRFRVWLRGGDPATLPDKLPARNRILRTILSQERRDTEKALWTKLFAMPPTHVIHYGWRSLATGQTYEILYIALNFDYPGQDRDALAREFSAYLIDCLGVLGAYDLCPPTEPEARLREVQEFFLVLAFRHYFYKLIESPRGIWSSRSEFDDHILKQGDD